MALEKVAELSINKLEDIPKVATSIKAEITLYKSEGEDIVNTWTATSFPFVINQGGIENCSQGYIIIKWEWSYLDEEGVEIVDARTTKIDNISFTPN